MTQSPAKKSFFNRNVDLMNGPIFKSLLVFMLPILVSCLFQQLYNTVDTMIVGNVLGDTALAAIGACGAIYELLVGFGIGIGNGLAIVAARAYGAGDDDQLKQTVAGSIVIGIIASAVITLAGAAGLHPLLELLDTPAEILEDAYGYIIIIDFGVIVMFAYNLCAGLLRAIGNSFMPLVFLILSSVLNVILDLWFIAVLGMGVAGAGVATVITQGVSVAFCSLYVFRSARLLLPEKKHFHVESRLAASGPVLISIVSGFGGAVPIRGAAPRLGNAPPSPPRRSDIKPRERPSSRRRVASHARKPRRPCPIPCRTPAPLRLETRPGAPWTRRVARRRAARKGRDTFSGSSPHALRARTTRKTDVGRSLQPRPTSLPPLPARPRCMRLTRRKARHRGGPQSLRSKT